MLRDVLTATLTRIQQGAGLQLEELDDHFVALVRRGEHVMIFNSTAVTIQAIRKEAQKWV